MFTKEEIIVYGAGVEAEKFYCLYKDRFKILFFVDRNANRTFHGIPVYTFEEKEAEILEKYRDKRIIVAVGKIWYDEIAKILESKKLHEFEHFIHNSYLDKELVILYGNCNMGILEEYLSKNIEFQRKYVIKLFQLTSEGIYSYLQKCKILISQDILDGNSANMASLNEISQFLPADCEKIVIPHFGGINLYNSHIKKDAKEIILKHTGRDKVISNYRTLDFDIMQIIGKRDELIEAMIEDGKTVEEMEEFIKSEDSLNKDEIISNFKVNIDKLKKREENCSIRISDYILEQYKKELLFYDINHPVEKVIYEMGGRILRLLNIKIVNQNVKYIRSLGQGEVFVYESVKKALGMEWKQEYIKINCAETTLHKHPLTLREYLEEYRIWWGK